MSAKQFENQRVEQSIAYIVRAMRNESVIIAKRDEEVLRYQNRIAELEDSLKCAKSFLRESEHSREIARKELDRNLIGLAHWYQLGSTKVIDMIKEYDDEMESRIVGD